MNGTYNKQTKKIAEYYNKRAKNSDAIKAAGQWGSKELVPEICKEICGKLNIKKENNILEIGCGSGVLGEELKNKCNWYTGIDISKGMLKKFLENSTTPTILIQAITEVLPFLDKSFDIVIMNSVTMYFHQPNQLENTLKEMERITKKNGTIFIGDNVTPEGSYWELSWFQNMNSFKQKMVKPYIKIRKWLAKKNSRLSGKWSELHAEVSPEYIKNYFENKGKVIISESGASHIKNKRNKISGKTSKRVDFLIRLGMS